jgi:uncharacterized protein YdeI (YjbR/CyaY-like superfamily)
MNDDALTRDFDDRSMFREWLERNHASPDGVWIVFTKGSRSFTANDALEEAICFGWIDGQMKSIDGACYKKYFSPRKSKAKWSEKNTALFEKLRSQGKVTEYGMAAFRAPEAPRGAVDKDAMNRSNIEALKTALKGENDALESFENVAPSRQRQMAGFYADAKGEATREKRKARIVDALKAGYKGMLY